MPLKVFCLYPNFKFEGSLDERESSSGITFQGRQTKFNGLRIGISYFSVFFSPFVK